MESPHEIYRPAPVKPESVLRMHLITAIALMFVAGCFVKLNTTIEFVRIWGYGWPCIFYLPGRGPRIWDCLDSQALIVNAATAGTLLLVAWGAMEGFLRRREVREEYRDLCRAAEAGRYRWFHLHASTAGLLALSLCVMIWMSLPAELSAFSFGYALGWPFHFFEQPCSNRGSGQYSPLAIIGNFLTWLVMFLPGIVLFERYARRRLRPENGVPRA